MNSEAAKPPDRDRQHRSHQRAVCHGPHRKRCNHEDKASANHTSSANAIYHAAREVIASKPRYPEPAKQKADFPRINAQAVPEAGSKVGIECKLTCTLENRGQQQP